MRAKVDLLNCILSAWHCHHLFPKSAIQIETIEGISPSLVCSIHHIFCRQLVEAIPCEPTVPCVQHTSKDALKQKHHSSCNEKRHMHHPSSCKMQTVQFSYEPQRRVSGFSSSSIKVMDRCRTDINTHSSVVHKSSEDHMST